MANSISQTMTEDHRRCDRLLALTETSVSGADWQAIAQEASVFREAMERHFRFEEETLFPRLEAQAPMAAGPTGVMRMEHEQMRRMLDELADAVQGRRKGDLLGILETLHMLIQQHNAKEEAILYPMADNVLSAQSSEIVSGLEVA